MRKLKASSNTKYYLISIVIIASLVLSVGAYSARLPASGGDSGTWGDVLNTYLNGSLGLNATTLNVTNTYLADGTAAAPSYTFANDTDTGLFNASGTLGITVSGNNTANITGTSIQTVNGTVSAPAYSFGSDTDTGLFLNDTGVLGFVAGAAQILRILSSGLIATGNLTLSQTFAVGGFSSQLYNAIGDGSGTANNPASDNDLYIEDILEVDGNVYLGDTTGDAHVITGDVDIEAGGVCISSTTCTAPTDGDFQVGGDLFIGHDAAGDNDFAYFDMGSESISWDNAGAEFDISDDLNMNLNTITNIGVAGTDFDASGGLTLGGNLNTTGTLAVGSGTASLAISGIFINNSAPLTYGSISGGYCDPSQIITVTGASTGDAVFLGAPSTILAAGSNLTWSGYVSSGNTVLVVLCNTGSAAINPSGPTSWSAVVFSI